MRPECRWLKHTESDGIRGSCGIIIGNCALLGGTAYDVRCEGCPDWREVSR